MTVTWQIDPGSTALIIHDLINEMADEKGLFYDLAIKQVLANVQRLLDACRARGILIVYAAPGWTGPADFGRLADFYPEIIARGAMRAGTWDTEIHPSIAPKRGDMVIHKKRVGAFYGSSLDRRLKARAIDTVIVTGTSTGVGCDMTARDALNRDYKVIVVSDACLSRPIADQGWGAVSKQELEKVHFSSLARAFAMVTDTEGILKLL